MSRGWKLLIPGLWLSALLLWLLLPRPSQPGEGAPLAATIPPTWTPTVPATMAPPSATPTAILATATPVATRTPTPLPPSATPTATATPLPPTPTPRPAASPVIAADGRIDAVGPIPLATIEPLPFGAGRLPVRLIIPALGLDTEVKPMGWHVVEDASGARSEWDVVDYAAGHHINTAYPGEPSNVVLSGHNNIGGSVFRSVCVIGEPGVDFGLEDDMVLVDQLGRRFIYQVDGWQRLAERNASIATRLENAQWMAPTPFAQLTLVTCWPPWSNTHRVVVTGVLTGMELP